MLHHTSEQSFGASRIRSGLFVAAGLRGTLVWRQRMCFDSRFLATSPRAEPCVNLQCVRSGALTIDGAPVPTPALLAYADDEFEHRGPDAPVVRSWGDPAVVLSLQVSATEVVSPIGLGGGPIAVSAAVWHGIDDLVAALHARHQATAVMQDIVARLVQDGVFAPTLAGAADPSPGPITKAWSALAPAVTQLDANPSQAALAERAGISVRQLGRDLRVLTKALGFLGGGFRDTMRVARLRLAVLLLSSPEATLAEVAKRVGYGSADALARGFRDAGLPTPGEVRDAVLYREIP